MEQRKYSAVRKSLLMSWKVCARQAWESVRDKNYGQYNEFNLEKPALLLGQIFHKEMDKFYNGISVSAMSSIADDVNLGDEDKLEQLEIHCFQAFSPTKHETCLTYFHWYAKIEAERFLELYKNNKDDIALKFIPLYIEKYVEVPDEENGIVRNGHFDRMDIIGDKKLRLVEYKTGKSYDITKSYKLSKLRLELYYYKKIVEQLEEFKGYEVVEWMLINPTLEVVFKSKFSGLTLNSLEKAMKSLADDINSETPPKRTLNFYCENCDYKQKCLIDGDVNIFEVEE